MKIETMAVVTFLAFGAGMLAGTRITEKTLTNKYQTKIELQKSEIERFQNQEVFNHAQKVAAITGRPLYQVLTGKKAR